MMKNKLTLKSLQQELENMKIKSGTKSKAKTPAVNENINKGAVGHDIKNSYIQRLYMKSSGLTLYLITGVLAYATKIPFIKWIISILGAYYGRTTIWKFLSSLRKIFIVINALIGAVIVFKSVGFSSDILLHNFILLGETYVQALGSIFKKVFHWFVELFDHKIVPNVPGDSNSGILGSKPKPQISTNKWLGPTHYDPQDFWNSDAFSLRELYKNATPQASVPWYKDSSTWFWIGVSVATIGVVYIGYQLVTDPAYIVSFFKSTAPTINTQGPTPPAIGVDPNSSSDITLNQGPISRIGNIATSVTKGFVSTYNSTINKLNPFSWYPSVSETQSQFNVFMEVQNDLNRADRSLYPFTEVNPFDGWLKKMRLHYLGESSTEFLERTRMRMHAERVLNSLSVSKGKAIDVTGGSPIFSASNSPLTSRTVTPIASVGLRSNIAGPSFLEISDKASNLLTESKIGTISPTPSVIPTVATEPWVSHTADKGPDAYNALDLWKKNKELHSSIQGQDIISDFPLDNDYLDGILPLFQ